MTAALEGGEWSAARPGHTLPRGRPCTHFTGATQRMGRGIALLFHDRGTRRGEFIIYNIYYTIFIIYYSSDSPSSLITESLSVTQSLSSAMVRLYRWQLNGHFTHGTLVG